MPSNFFSPVPPLMNLPGTYNDSAQLDSDGDKVAFIVKAPKTGTINKISGYYAGMSGSHTVSIGLFTVDSSGNPTLTNYGGSATETGITTGSSFQTWSRTLSTPATATKGDIFAVVITMTTWGGSGYARIAETTFNTIRTLFPYRAFYDGATWTKTADFRPCLGIFYNDSTAPMTPFFDSAYPTTSSSTAAQKQGNRYVPSADVDAVGMVFVGRLPVTNTYNYFIDVFDPVTRVQTHGYDANNSAAPNNHGPHFFPFYPVVRLTAGTSYVFGIETASGSAQYERTLLTGEDSSFVWIEQSSGLQTFSNTVRTTGAWTTTDHDYTSIFPILRSL